jgi:hypothetical protein
LHQNPPTEFAISFAPGVPKQMCSKIGQPELVEQLLEGSTVIDSSCWNLYVNDWGE